MKIKTITLSLLLGLAAASVFAEAQYLVRVPANVNLAAPEAPAPEEATSIALRSATLPTGTVGVPYGESQTGFDLTLLLDVTPSSYSLNDISWSVVSGALPAGLEIQADGKLAGTPTLKNEAGASFEVAASYKGATGARAYTLLVEDAGVKIANFGAYNAWVDGSFARSCFEYKNPPAGYAYAGAVGDGIYRVKLDGQSASNVWCNMTIDGGGWSLAFAGDHSVSGRDWKVAQVTQGQPMMTYTNNPVARPVLAGGTPIAYSQVLFKGGDAIWTSRMGGWVRFSVLTASNNTVSVTLPGVLTESGLTSAWLDMRAWGYPTIPLTGRLSLWDADGVSPICGGGSVPGPQSCPTLEYTTWPYHFDYTSYKEVYFR